MLLFCCFDFVFQTKLSYFMFTLYKNYQNMMNIDVLNVNIMEVAEQFNLIQLMLSKKQRRIIRHRLPNLCEPGMRFDRFKSDGPTFFSKISNTLKLLQQPIEFKKQVANDQGFNFNQYLKSRLRRNNASMRTNQLAKPKNLSFSVPKRQQFTNKKQRKLRYSSSEIQGKSVNRSHVKEQQIIGTGLASLPLERILAARQQYLKIKQNIYNDESQQDEQQFNKVMNQVQDLEPLKDDFRKWSQKIVGGQGKLYEHYEKIMLDKIKQGSKRTKKVSHQIVWK